MRRWLALVLVAAVALAGCGEGEEVPAPTPVDPALAPTDIPPDLALHRNQDEETLAAFANAGDRTVLADGQVWEIRRKDRLIGTLQISTVLPEVDLGELRTRETLVRQILATEPRSVFISDVEVYLVELEDRASYVWFGDGIFEVVQVRDRTVDSFESIVESIIEHQRTVPAWVPLPQESLAP